MEYKNKRVMVLGLGRTGETVKRFLSFRGASVCCYDDGRGGVGETLCERFDFAVISPGFPLTNRAAVRLKEQGVPILSELDLAYINCPTDRIYAVSGTNGKTTTCRILAEMLSAVGPCHLVGNIGEPFIAAVDRIAAKDAVVVEVSSFQIEQSGMFRPMIAALTNVGEDHLDRHKSAATYQNLKLSFAKKAGISVLNGDDPVQGGIEGVRYSLSDPSADFFLSDRTITWRGKDYTLPPESRGAGFDRDYLCAFAIACTAYGAQKEFLSAYERVELPPYRFQKIGRLRGAEVFNDSKGTNIDAALFAFSQCKGRVAIILGGSDKGEDYGRLMRGIAGAERIYLVGANAADLLLAAEPDCRVKCLPMADLESCVRHFCSDPLDTLLFSPASASFDRYENYEERGRDFDAIVGKYRLD